jgi:GT2 family glycosyltransferase
MSEDVRASIVVLTHNRRVQLLSTLESLRQLPGNWPIIVVDNGSHDETASAVAARFPSVMLIRVRQNLGAAARNLGVAYAHTPYVAFCDDDTQWESGALERAVAVLDSAPNVAVLSACVQVGPTRRIDPACLAMAHSPLPREGLPGPQLLGFMAGASVIRTRAFYDVGGYWPPFFIGGEEALMAMDMVERGWRIIYDDKVVTRHFPSSLRDSGLRNRLVLRNAIWVGWMRRPWRSAWRETSARLREARTRQVFWRVVMDARLGFAKVLRRRRVISPAVESLCLLLEEGRAPVTRARVRHPA